jgi:hypothetical protein
MPAPLTHYGRHVTGRARFRKQVSLWRVLTFAADPCRLVLEVEVEDRPLDSAMGEPSYRWIDAHDGDLYALRYYRNHKKLEPLL